MWALSALAVALGIASLAGATEPVRPVPGSWHAQDHRLSDLEQRAAALERDARSVRSTYINDVEPLKRQLMRYSSDEELVTHVAIALVREGRSAGVNPGLLASVLLVEDPMLDPQVLSPVGAVGLMQVMPRHAGAWGCGSDDLTDPDTNICHGARILAHDLYLAHGNLDRALLRYNGCVYGTNTPDCDLYPRKVYRHQVTLARLDRGRGERTTAPVE